NPFMMFRKKMENKRQESLTVEELNAIKEIKFASDVLDQVRDIFVFSCCTGLAYNEVSKLTPAHIKVADGKLCIFQARDKTRRTNNEAYVPLGYDALEILNRYNEHPVCLRKGVCLPVQANQRVNAYLKQIQHLAGIKKRLTTHTARRTFANHRINEGFEAVVVSAMMAHSDVSTTMRYYAKVSPEAVVREFQRIRDTKTKNG
ncbi:site-specific integrase, partial [Runella sp.]|uniref:site-specific integrase n=1 Tax=Runella sp. TaxID=1960881 RepID=UPI003019931A